MNKIYNYIYVCIEDRYNYHNTLHYTTNLGATWDTITTIPFSNSISRIAADPKNERILWATFSGYGAEKAGFYNLATGTWTMRNSGLPNVPVNCIVIDTFSKTKYVGTDLGVFYMDTTMSSWGPYSVNLPTATVQDLNINYTTGHLWAATYGRGMWRTTKHENPSEISIIPYAADIITVSPNPNKGAFTIKTSHSQLKGQPVKVRMIAATGATAWSEDAAFDSNGNLKLNIKGLAPGAYICETGNSQAIARCRVMIY